MTSGPASRSEGPEAIRGSSLFPPRSASQAVRVPRTVRPEVSTGGGTVVMCSIASISTRHFQPTLKAPGKRPAAANEASCWDVRASSSRPLRSSSISSSSYSILHRAPLAVKGRVSLTAKRGGSPARGRKPTSLGVGQGRVRYLGEKAPSISSGRPMHRLGPPPAQLSVKLHGRVTARSGEGQCAPLDRDRFMHPTQKCAIHGRMTSWRGLWCCGPSGSGKDVAPAHVCDLFRVRAPDRPRR